MATTIYRDLVLSELEELPDEYLPFVLQMMSSFRQSIALKPAPASFRQGWEEAQRGETYPLNVLWDGIDVE